MNVFPIRLPALRERADDLPALVWKFVEEFSKSFDKPIDSISKSNMEALQAYQWPGNIRELRNVIERAVIVATTPRLTIEVPHSPRLKPIPASEPGSRDEIDRHHIRSGVGSHGVARAWRTRRRRHSETQTDDARSPHGEARIAPAHAVAPIDFGETPTARRDFDGPLARFLFRQNPFPFNSNRLGRDSG